MVTAATRRGYTVIEIAVVVFIIGVFGVMVAIGALSVADSEAEKLAAAHAADAIAEQQRFAQRFGTYTGHPADLAAADGYDVVVDESSDHTQVSVALGESGTLGVAVRRNDSECLHWRVGALAAGGGVAEVTLAANAVCTGEEALPANEPRAANSATTSAAW